MSQIAQNNQDQNLELSYKSLKIVDQYKYPQIKSVILERIQAKKQKGEIKPEKKITDKLLADEYWRYWVQLDHYNEKTKIDILKGHPSLLEEDQKRMGQIIQEEINSRAIWVLGISAVNYSLYRVFFSKRAFFYNYFQKKHKFRVFSFIKKGFGAIGLILTTGTLLSLLFDKTIPTKLAQEQFFKKYGIEYEKQNY